MNEIIHFATGYLVARLLKKKHFSFESLFIAFAAFLVDIDFVLGIEHGVATHTILGCIVISLIFASITKVFMIFFPSSVKIPYMKLIFLALLGTISHLCLDAFTYLPDDPMERASEIDHHMFFWPLSNFPVHINTVFPSATYDLRVAIEVIYSIVVGVYIIVYMGIIKKQNFVECINPKKWGLGSGEPPSKSEWIYVVLVLIVITLELISGYI
jgi:hypothetical protein